MGETPKEIFISYRREDVPYAALLLARDLQEAFGDVVFLDVGIREGDDWEEQIVRALAQARVVLVLIGPDWFLCKEGRSQPRINDPSDWVHHELRHALDSDACVILQPLSPASCPPVEDYPPELRRRMQRCTIEGTVPY